MKHTYLPYIQAVSDLGIDSETKARVVAAAVAIATAQFLQLPSTPVESPASYYNGSLAMTAREEIGEYNEQAVLDIQSALSLTEKFWLLRYSAVHQPVTNPPLKGAFFLGFTGAMRFFSEEEITFLNEQAHKIFLIQHSIDCVKKNKPDVLGGSTAPAPLADSDSSLC